MSKSVRQQIFDDIDAERLVQETRHGGKHLHPVWGILVDKQLGDAARAWLDGRKDDFRHQMIQVIALYVAQLEHLDERGNTDLF